MVTQTRPARNRSGAAQPLLTPVDRWTAEQWSAALARAQERGIKANCGPYRILGQDRAHATVSVDSASGRGAHTVHLVWKGERCAVSCDCRDGYPDVAPCQHAAAALYPNWWSWVPQLPVENRWLCPHCGGGFQFRRRQRNATHDWMVKCYQCFYRAWVDEHTAREQVTA